MAINDPSLENPPAGAIRFNTDSRKIEVYCGGPVGFGTTTITGAWFQIDSFAPDTATGGARGVFGVVSPTYSNTLEYITIATTGNSVNFGNLSRGSGNQAAMCASATTGLHGGGIIAPAASFTNTVEYITISSTGNAATFGQLTSARRYLTALANSTRGVFAGGAGGATNTIDYVTIASTGNAVSFGQLSVSRGISEIGRAHV